MSPSSPVGINVSVLEGGGRCGIHLVRWRLVMRASAVVCGGILAGL